VARGFFLDKFAQEKIAPSHLTSSLTLFPSVPPYFGAKFHAALVIGVLASKWTCSLGVYILTGQKANL
jgi:hypothetical protein